MWRSPSSGESRPEEGPRPRGSPEAIRFPYHSPFSVSKHACVVSCHPVRGVELSAGSLRVRSRNRAAHGRRFSPLRKTRRMSRTRRRALHPVLPSSSCMKTTRAGAWSSFHRRKGTLRVHPHRMRTRSARTVLHRHRICTHRWAFFPPRPWARSSFRTCLLNRHGVSRFAMVSNVESGVRKTFHKSSRPDLLVFAISHLGHSESARLHAGAGPRGILLKIRANKDTIPPIECPKVTAVSAGKRLAADARITHQGSGLWPSRGRGSETG